MFNSLFALLVAVSFGAAAAQTPNCTFAAGSRCCALSNGVQCCGFSSTSKGAISGCACASKKKG